MSKLETINSWSNRTCGKRKFISISRFRGLTQGHAFLLSWPNPFLFSCSFFEKFVQNIGWQTHPSNHRPDILDPPLLSDLADVITFERFTVAKISFTVQYYHIYNDSITIESIFKWMWRTSRSTRFWLTIYCQLSDILVLPIQLKRKYIEF